MAQLNYNYLTGKTPKKTLFDAASYSGIPEEVSSQANKKTAAELLSEAEAYVKEQTKDIVPPERDLSYDKTEGGLLTEKIKQGAGALAEKVEGSTLLTDTVEQTKSALNDLGISDFSLDTTKQLVKEGGEAVVPAIKQGVDYAKNFLGDSAPTNTVEGFGTVLAMPTPKLTSEEQSQVKAGMQEQEQEAAVAVQQHSQIDPDTEEGRNAWERTANYFKVPVDWLIDSWKKLDEKAGGYPSGIAGVLGSAGGAVAEGASYINDKIDFFQMLAVGAQAATRTNNVGVAVMQGLAGGIQARQQQKAAAAKQKADDARWKAEQDVRVYNAHTSRGRAVADAKKQGEKANLLELTTSDNKMVSTVAEGAKVSEEVVQSAIINLKASGKQYGPQQVRNEIERMRASGEISDKWFGKDKLM